MAAITSPREIISHAVWLYFRLCLSVRDSEDLLATARGMGGGYVAPSMEGTVLNILVRPRRDARAARASCENDGGGRGSTGTAARLRDAAQRPGTDRVDGRALGQEQEVVRDVSVLCTGGTNGDTSRIMNAAMPSQAFPTF